MKLRQHHSSAAAPAGDRRGGGMDRRRILQQALALGLTAPEVTALLARNAQAHGLPTVGGAEPVEPPVAEPRPQIRVFSGVSLSDPYAWLENPDDPEVIAYLEEENAYAEAIMEPTRRLQRELYREMIGRVKRTDATEQGNRILKWLDVGAKGVERRAVDRPV